MLGRILWETPLWWDILKHLMMFVNAHSRPAGSAKTLCLNTHAHGALMSAKLCLRPGMTSEERRTCCRAVVVTLDKDVIQFLWHQLIKPSQRAATLDFADLKVIAFCCSWGTETCFQQLLLLRRRELVTDNKCPCCVSATASKQSGRGSTEQPEMKVLNFRTLFRHRYTRRGLWLFYFQQESMNSC